MAIGNDWARYDDIMRYYQQSNLYGQINRGIQQYIPSHLVDENIDEKTIKRKPNKKLLLLEEEL